MLSLGGICAESFGHSVVILLIDSNVCCVQQVLLWTCLLDWLFVVHYISQRVLLGNPYIAVGSLRVFLAGSRHITHPA